MSAIGISASAPHYTNSDLSVCLAHLSWRVELYHQRDLEILFLAFLQTTNSFSSSKYQALEIQTHLRII